MSTVTYQPSYSTSKGGRFGFRYLAQPPAPNIGNPAIPPNQTVDSSQATPSKTMGSGANMQDPFVGDSDFEFAANKIPAAQSLGYTQGNQSLINAIPVVGTIARMTGYEGPKDTYGNYGTYDAEGNVFGTQGRAYDPVTGQAANSYATTGDYLGSYLGIGTEGGFLGPDSSYGKLRAAGENIPSSLLGSYENSIYRQAEIDPTIDLTDPLGRGQARVNRNIYGSAMGQGVNTIGSQIAANTMLSGRGMAGSSGLYSDDDIDRLEKTDITKEMLGFTDARPSPGPISGNFGTTAGDIVGTQSGYGVINESGQIETPSGTVVQVTDPVTGQSVSLLNGPGNIAAQETLGRLSDSPGQAELDSSRSVSSEDMGLFSGPDTVTVDGVTYDNKPADFGPGTPGYKAEYGVEPEDDNSNSGKG